MLKNHRDLKVWQKSHELCLGIYTITAKFPKDYIGMLYIYYGSVCELETQILLAGGLDLIEKSELGTLKKDIAEIERMLTALIKSLENKPLNP
jgi:hypothetical protein